MKRTDALPGNYLAKEDFPKPVLAHVARVEVEEIQSDKGDAKKPCLYVCEASDPNLDTARGLLLNGTNWDALEGITGKDDSDDWTGHAIVLFHDPSVQYMGRKVGGVRIRKPARDVPVKEVKPAAPAPTGGSSEALDGEIDF